MAKITAYEATDGTIFKDKSKFKEHQERLNVIDGLTKIADRIEGDPEYLMDDLGPQSYVLAAEDIPGFILANKDDILKALAGKPLEIPGAPEVPPAGGDDLGSPVAAGLDRTTSGAIGQP